MRSSDELGFTLIELMITVTIICILASVALPAYQSYTKDAANNACMSEANEYARKVYAEIQLNKSVSDIPTPVARACSNINNGTAVVTMTRFASTARSPGNATINCDLNVGTPCSITSVTP